MGLFDKLANRAKEMQKKALESLEEKSSLIGTGTLDKLKQSLNQGDSTHASSAPVPPPPPPYQEEEEWEEEELYEENIEDFDEDLDDEDFDEDFDEEAFDEDFDEDEYEDEEFDDNS
ncbi:MAG: hypothetical protein K2H18_01365, partial [Muribaculaceae bacterium]|nr:hypothetical protein [Muribaculaceae bacterium]